LKPPPELSARGVIGKPNWLVAAAVTTRVFAAAPSTTLLAAPFWSVAVEGGRLSTGAKSSYVTPNEASWPRHSDRAGGAGRGSTDVDEKARGDGAAGVRKDNCGIMLRQITSD
jgi:hypothetical protein